MAANLVYNYLLMMPTVVRMRTEMRQLPTDEARRGYVQLASTQVLFALHGLLRTGYTPGFRAADMRCWDIVMRELVLRRNVPISVLFADEELGVDNFYSVAMQVPQHD